MESEFYKIRNTLIYTDPVLEIGVDPRYASQDKTDEDAGNVTIEGMHIGLKSGMFLGIADNTSIIQGTVVDYNLNPLEGYSVTVYRVQNNQAPPTASPSSSFSLAAPPIEVTLEHTNAKGSFTIDDLRSDNYLLSLSLPLERYWLIFVDRIFGEEKDGGGGTDENNNYHNHDDNEQEREKEEITNALLLPPKNNSTGPDNNNNDDNNNNLPEDKGNDQGYSSVEVAKHHLDAILKIIEIEIINALLLPPKNNSTGPDNNNNDDNNNNLPEDKGNDQGYSSVEVAKHHLDAILKIIEIIKSNNEREEEANLPYLESRLGAYIIDILGVILEIENLITNQILPLIEAGSGETSESSPSSSPSTSSLLNRSLADAIKIIEGGLKLRLDELRSRAQQMLNHLPNERRSTFNCICKGIHK